MKCKTKVKALILIVVIFLSCKKESSINIPCDNPTSEISPTKELIKGHWTWAYEKFFNRNTGQYIIKTPETEAVTKQYDFKSSNEVRTYLNNNLTSTALFEITTFAAVTGIEEDKKIIILLIKDKSTGQRIDFSPIQICNDTLTLHYDFYSDTQGMEKWYRN